MEQHWLGLRTEELSPDQVRSLEVDPELRDAHVRELEFGRRFSLPPAVFERPNVRDVFARAHYATKTYSRMRGVATGRPLMVSLPILVLVSLLWIYTWMGGEMPWESTGSTGQTRNQQVDSLSGPEKVRLTTLASSLAAERPLQDGGIIEPHEGLRFSVQVTGVGYLLILDTTEGIKPLYPALDPSSWQVSDGHHQPVAELRVPRPTSDQASRRVYRALLCRRPPWVVEGELPDECIFSDVTLTWR